jgi:hypothetical protein
MINTNVLRMVRMDDIAVGVMRQTWGAGETQACRA